MRRKRSCCNHLSNLNCATPRNLQALPPRARQGQGGPSPRQLLIKAMYCPAMHSPGGEPQERAWPSLRGAAQSRRAPSTKKLPSAATCRTGSWRWSSDPRQSWTHWILAPSGHKKNKDRHVTGWESRKEPGCSLQLLK